MITLELSERDLNIIVMALGIRINQLRMRLLEEDNEEDSKNFLDTIAMFKKIQEMAGREAGV